uniref:NrfD/PsrC family molybdoenzyme membrane anchor subunit n=1 Tax=Gordonibacter urolithinfaciens TaxID=1335613 RepID=UPI003AAAAB35
MTENVSATIASPGASAPEKEPRPARFGGRGISIGIAVAALVAVAGIALWAVQLSGGLVQTGMRNLDSWGLYITLFMFLVGLSAGGLIISSVPRAFGMK